MKNWLVFLMLFVIVNLTGCSGGEGVSVSDLQRNGIGNLESSDYFSTGITAFSQNNFLDAKASFEKALGVSSNSEEVAGARAGMGFVSARLGNFEEAIQYFKQSSLNDANFGEALSLFRRNQVGDISNAIQNLESGGLFTGKYEFLFSYQWGHRPHDANALYAILLYFRDSGADKVVSSQQMNYALIENQKDYSSFVENISQTLKNLQQ